MTVPDYSSELAAFANRPVYIVQIYLQSPVSASTQTFILQEQGVDSLSSQFGQNVYPYITSVQGRGARIHPTDGLTERGRMTVACIDDENPPDFDSSLFPDAYTGGSFFRRLILAQPDWVGTLVVVRRGFVSDSALLSSPAYFRTIFSGTLQDINFEEGQKVSLILKDRMLFTERNVPAAISDDNLLAVTMISNTIEVVNGSEFTDPADLPSKDYFGVVVRVDYDTGSAEDIIIQSKVGNIMTAQTNFIKYSEAFDQSPWSYYLTTVYPNVAPGPWGGDFKADLVSFSSGGSVIQQGNSMGPSPGWVVFSVWLRSSTGVAGPFRLKLACGSDNAFAYITIYPYWTRVNVTLYTLSSSNVFVSFGPDGSGGLKGVYAFGAQLEYGEAPGFYAPTLSVGGTAAGRGQYGTTLVTHWAGAKVKEILPYRYPYTATPDTDGVHPWVVLRDLINRGRATSVLEADFQNLFEFSPGLMLRRGRTSTADNTIVDSRALSQYIKEVREQTLIDVWPSENQGIRAAYSWAINDPYRSDILINDEENVVLNSARYESNIQSRVTRCFVYWGALADKGGTDPSDYENVQVGVELGVESYSGEKVRVIFSQWIFRSTEAGTLASRILRRFKRGAKIGHWKFSIKDDETIRLGDFLSLNTKDLLLVGAGGQVTRGYTRFQITQKVAKPKQGVIEVEGMEAAGAKVGMIGPGGMPGYPTATAAQRAYAFIADNQAKVCDTLGVNPWNLTAGVYTESTKRIVETGAFAGFTYTGSDYIHLQGGGMAPSYHHIAAKISDNEIELSTYLRNSSNNLIGNQTGIVGTSSAFRNVLVDGYTIL